MTQAHNHILPLKSPSPLPASGVDIITCKVWKNMRISHVQQDANHHHFMDDGRYAEWHAAELVTRIRELYEDEKLSPSFKNATVLWSLEKIDPRLSLEVKRIMATK